MSSYKYKGTPPKNVQRMLLNKGLVFQTAPQGEDPVWEEHLRYQKWCKSVVRSFRRKVTITRKKIRQAKRFFAYDNEDVIAEEDFLTSEAIE